MAGRLEEPSLSQIVIVCKNSCSMALEAVQPAPQSRKPACLLAKKFWLCPETWGMNASGTDKLTAQTVPKHPWQMDGEDSPVMSLGIRRDVPEPLRATLHESRTADGPSVATA